MVIKFILPTMTDLKVSPIRHDKECKYLYNLDDKDNEQIKENIRDLLSYYTKLRPYMSFYKMQINACNKNCTSYIKE